MTLRRLVLALSVLSALAFQTPFARAQAAATPAADTASSSAVPDTAVASTTDYVEAVREAFTPENRRYSRTGVILAVIAPFYALLMAMLVLFAGWSAKIRDLAVRVTRFRYVHTLIYVALYSLVAAVLALPLAWYGGYLVEHQYGLSNQTLPQWFGDQAKDLAVSILILGVLPVTWLAYAAIRKTRHWWAWLGAGTLPLVLLVVVVQPVWIDPLYNDFKPLEDKVLEARVLELAERTGIPGRNVYQVDKSEQTKKLNAYVNGFGVSQRVVFWDTIIDAMDHDELAVVAGHEMGHYVLGHMWKTVGFITLLAFALFFFSAKVMNALVARFGSRWGFTELHDLASIPLLGATITLVAFFAQPAMNAFSRFQEHEADIYALELTHLNDAGARTFLKLGTQNKANPEPSTLETIMLWSHPPLVERVRFMQTYRPWEEGEPNRLYEGPE